MNQWRKVCSIMIVMLMVVITPTSAAKERSMLAKGDYTNTLGMKFVLINPGTFMMGAPIKEADRYSSETQHRVTLTKAFYIQMTEMTQAQWQAVMGNNPSYFEGSNLPVEQVSWNDIQDFIRRLNSRGYRLPTEAEWEYAAKAGTTDTFGVEDRYKLNLGQVKLHEDCPQRQKWSGIYLQKTRPARSSWPNAWGLYGMYGNVYEWVQDWYGDYPAGAITNPKGPVEGTFRVGRGGCWHCYGQLCRAAFCGRAVPSSRFNFLGFRLVRSVE